MMNAKNWFQHMGTDMRIYWFLLNRSFLLYILNTYINYIFKRESYIAHLIFINSTK